MMNQTSVPESRASSLRNRIGRVVGLAVITSVGLAFNFAHAQTRDHLTDAETELVRYNQQLDKRIEVFIKAIDRRFGILTGAPQPEVKKKEKDKDKEDWGEPPTGTRAQLLEDIAGILDEAITNIDDVGRRDEKNPLLSRSLRNLTAASNRFLSEVTTLKAQTKDPDELSAMDHITDNANQIVEVGNKLPAPPPDENKKKKGKP